MARDDDSWGFGKIEKIVVARISSSGLISLKMFLGGRLCKGEGLFDREA